MLTENTVTKLQEMKLTAMARAFKEQLTDPNINGLLFKFFANSSRRNLYRCSSAGLLSKKFLAPSMPVDSSSDNSLKRRGAPSFVFA